MTTFIGTTGNDDGFLDTYDELYGAGGNDFLVATGPGNCALYGGSGSDFLALWDTYDTIYGSMYGDTGDDTIQGYKNNDVQYGGEGNDLVTGGTGTQKAGDGSEWVGNQPSGNDLIDGGNGTDALYGFDGNDQIYGGAGDDSGFVVSAGSAYYMNLPSFLISKAGLSGGAGNDFLDGGSGKDFLDGGIGNDKLLGQTGDDTLLGGSGADVLKGGGGADVFVFASRTDSKVVAAGRDTIADFHAAQHDQIDLHLIDANTKLGGNQSFHLIDSDAFGHRAGELQVQALGADTIVCGDVNGDAKADFAIMLSGHVPLQDGDFLL